MKVEDLDALQLALDALKVAARNAQSSGVLLEVEPCVALGMVDRIRELESQLAFAKRQKMSPPRFR